MKKKPELKKTSKPKKATPKIKAIKPKAKARKKQKPTSIVAEPILRLPEKDLKGKSKRVGKGKALFSMEHPIPPKAKVNKKRKEASTPASKFFRNLPGITDGRQISRDIRLAREEEKVKKESVYNKSMDNFKKEQQAWNQIHLIADKQDSPAVYVFISFILFAIPESVKIVKCVENNVFQPYETTECKTHCALHCIRIKKYCHHETIPKHIMKLSEMGCIIHTVDTALDALGILERIQAKIKY